MTPLIHDVLDEVLTAEGIDLVSTLTGFVEWIEATKWRMRHDHALRFEFPNFELYRKDPAFYWPHILKGLS